MLHPLQSLGLAAITAVARLLRLRACPRLHPRPPRLRAPLHLLIRLRRRRDLTQTPSARCIVRAHHLNTGRSRIDPHSSIHVQSRRITPTQTILSSALSPPPETSPSRVPSQLKAKASTTTTAGNSARTLRSATTSSSYTRPSASSQQPTPSPTQSYSSLSTRMTRQTSRCSARR